MMFDNNWWLENIHEVVNPFCREEPHVVIETDASMNGWGGVCRYLNLITGILGKMTKQMIILMS